MRSVFWKVSFLVMFFSIPSGYACAKFFEDFDPSPTPEESAYVDRSAPGLLYYVTDAKNPDFYVDAGVTDRVLTMTFSLKEAGERSTGLRGKDQYAKILKFFAGRFDKIQTSWMDEPGGNDNLIAFNKAIEEGKTPEEAARLTWSGQRAVEAGYSKVEIIETKKNQGKYTYFRAHFSRP